MNYQIRHNPYSQHLAPKKSVSAIVLGILSIVFASLSLLVAWIPLIGLLTVPLSVLAIILGFIGVICSMCKSGANMGPPAVGLFLGVAAIILPFVWFV